MIRLFANQQKKFQNLFVNKSKLYFCVSRGESNCVEDVKNKKYILSQFPYPSGQLHLGHARVYYIGDTLARYYKLQGFKVIYPIGFDSFGLPAQNAAIVHKKNPKFWTQNNINQMKQQLNSLNIDFDWDRQFATHKPQYYKWTQLIFVKMLQKGLAYKSQSEVNWDPIDNTVLANEQVDNLGRSWRSGALVQKKMLSQWFFKITSYAQELQNNLPNLEWIEKVKAMQAGWIGFQKGYELQLEIESINDLAIKKLAEKQKKILEDFNGKKIKIFIKDKKILNKGEFYIRYNQQPNEGEVNEKQIILGFVKNINTHHKNQRVSIILGHQQNGIKFQLVSKLDEQKAQDFQAIKLNLSDKSVMRIKDWSISRQRYWGTPIPVIYCKGCGVLPVPESQLPVTLPEWKGQGNPLLSDSFKRCKCPKCGGEAERQTDTMDTFVDSSWYYLRFLDSLNENEICNKRMADFWMPVDIYIGGIEHAIMHLLYARFIMRTLFDMNISEVKQPFKELVVQGLVKGKAIRHKLTGKYLKPSQISNYNSNQLEQTYQKMSKSKFNGLNPQTLVQKYGPDALRIAMFFASPPEHDVDFHQDLLVSADRFLNRVEQTWKRVQQLKENVQNDLILKDDEVDKNIAHLSNVMSKQSFKLKKIIAKLQQSIQKRYMHVYIANTMQLFNEIKNIEKQFKGKDGQIKQKGESFIFIFESIFIPILSVVAPTTTKKLHKSSLKKFVWPKSQHFKNRKQYLIMKGNKLIKKGFIECNEEQDNISEQEIRSKLNLTADAAIKNSKKNIIILTK